MWLRCFIDFLFLCFRLGGGAKGSKEKLFPIVKNVLEKSTISVLKIAQSKGLLTILPCFLNLNDNFFLKKKSFQV